MGNSIFYRLRWSVYYAFKDWTYGCFLRKKVDKWLLFRVYNPIVRTLYYDVILLKIGRLGLDP